MTPEKMDNVVDSCRRCGTCCKKGGPALHVEDRDLVESGRIPLRDLYTIRRGELVRDNVRGTLQPLDAEIIKIKARQTESWTCRFYDDPDSNCRIYASRPIECRALQCWDTREIERIYATGRLQRKDLLGKLESLWDLIEDHDRRCSYETLGRLIRRIKEDGNQADADNVLEILQYDAEFRNLVIERGNLDPEMLDFLLGRPLEETIHQFGIRREYGDGRKMRLVFQKNLAAGETKNGAGD